MNNDRIATLEKALAVPVSDYLAYQEANKYLIEVESEYKAVVAGINAHREFLAVELAKEKGKISE